MRKNVASQVVAFQAISTTDGSPVTAGTPTIYYTIDGGTQGTGTGTATHEGNGQWSYVPAQAETNGSHVAFTFTLTGAINQTVNVWPVAYDPTDSIRLGLTALPNAVAGAAGGLPTDSTGKTAFNDLDAAGVRSAIGLAAANLDTQLSTIDSVVDAILDDTGTSGIVISAATANQIADAILNRDFSAVSDTNARSALNALRFLRNKYSLAGSTLTITKEDDATTAWTATVTTDAAADPVTGSDPA